MKKHVSKIKENRGSKRKKMMKKKKEKKENDGIYMLEPATQWSNID